MAPAQFLIARSSARCFLHVVVDYVPAAEAISAPSLRLASSGVFEQQANTLLPPNAARCALVSRSAAAVSYVVATFRAVR